MTMRWFGANRGYIDVTPEDAAGGALPPLEIGFNPAVFNAGDTLERIICYYWFQTHYIDNLTLTGPPFAMVVAAWWEPNPQADEIPTDPTSTDVFDASRGDALFVDYGRWRTDRFTDGAVNSTQWICDSGQPQSTKGTRTIQDVDTAVLKMGCMFGGWAGVSPTNILETPIDGFIAIRYLMNIKG